MLNFFLKLCFVSILLLPGLDAFQNDEKVTLIVEIEVTKHNNGQIAFALFDAADKFLKIPIRSDAKAVKNNKVIVEFDDIPKGNYSFSYYHDLNSNGELDTNFMGVPKEPYGFSNDQKGGFGPPSFEEAMIRIDKNTRLKLTIK